jgi:glutamyl-tRNA reductase
MCDRAGWQWGDPKIEWTALRTEELMHALTLMQEETRPFFDTQSERQQKDIIQNRLYQKRRNWGRQARKRRHQEVESGDTTRKSQASAPAGVNQIVGDDVLDIIQRTRNFQSSPNDDK